uniref:Rop guanine nucleotide exchange factor 1 n=1 Tax=Cajanus cajan TaxID=3821 RepID=A0A151TIV8_CAJCA|nr:Rop guanine nucleotide exchange factor 1 [Cajanus cajan]
MVRAFRHQKSMQKSKSFHFRKMFEIPGKHIHGLFERDHDEADETDKVYSKSYESKSSFDHRFEHAHNSDHSPAASLGCEAPKIPPKPKAPTESDMMKERFAKLLLGEDMSGAGNGVSSALALSNAITNLAASVFGESSKLEPMSAERKARWKREIGWLLSVTDHIVEFAPSQQIAKDGSTMEIMTTRQRTDLLMNIPALRKLDAMLIIAMEQDTLDNFRDQNEFWYVSKNDDDSEGNNQRKSDKWWLPTVKVPPTGMSEVAGKWIQYQKDNVTQVLKAAMAINAQILSEMGIPENYIESLPKNGRESLGESIYKSITVEFFDPGQFLATMDLSTEHKVLDLKNRIEASIVIWRRKMTNKDSKSSWSSAVSIEKRELFEERAETILLMLKHQYPGLPQSSLDISKIQYNKDVGQAILESYSRVIESLAYTVTSRIEDVLYADSVAKNPSLVVSSRRISLESVSEQTSPNSGKENSNLKSSGTPPSMTLSDFMEDSEECLNEKDEKIVNKSPKTPQPQKSFYLDKLEYLNALKSPIARH